MLIKQVTPERIFQEKKQKKDLQSDLINHKEDDPIKKIFYKKSRKLSVLKKPGKVVERRKTIDDAIIVEDFENAIDKFRASERFIKTKNKFENRTLSFQILTSLYYLELFLCTDEELKHSQSLAIKVTKLINDIPKVKRAEKKGMNFTFQGVKPIPYKHLLQFKNYLLGYYYHSLGNFKKALELYTASLYSADQKSVDYWKLLALEQIEKIVQIKTEEQKFGRKSKKI